MLSEEKYQNIVDAIYQAALDPTVWRQVVDQMTAGFQAIGASMFTPVAALIGLEPVWATDADPEFVAQYASKYARTDVLAKALMRRIPDSSFIYARDELVGLEAWRSWEGYRDLLKPRGVEQFIGLVVSGEDHRMSQLMVYLPESPQERLDEIKRTMSRLERHFAQAMRVHWHLSTARQEAADARYTLDQFQTGVAWLSEKGEVLYRNAELDRLLALRDGIASDNGMLRAGTRAQAEMIQAAVAAAQRGEERSFAIDRRSEAEPFRVRVLPLPLQASALRLPNAAAIAFISKASVPSATTIDAFAKLYGLSAAERRILGSIAAGKRPEDAATEAGIGYETGRTHLKSIMAKCNVSRQADLVRLVATTATG
jgi:DNA-binding CsgD family transcriptional regulator